MSSGEDKPQLTNDPSRYPEPVRYSAAEFPVPEKPEDSPKPSTSRDSTASKDLPDPRLKNDPSRYPKPVRYSAAEFPVPEKSDDTPKPSTSRNSAALKPKPGHEYLLDNDTEETSLITDKPKRYSAADPEANNGVIAEESFMRKCKRIKMESTSFLGFVFALLVFLSATIIASVLLVVSMAIPIAMLVIGIHYKDDCSGEDMIPIYLIVAGAVGIAKDVVNILDRIQRNPNDTSAGRNNMERLFNVFLFAWLIAGCVFVYRLYDDVQYDFKDQSDYCNHTVYWFTFWINTISITLLGIGFLFFCLFGLWCWVIQS